MKWYNVFLDEMCYSRTKRSSDDDKSFVGELAQTSEDDGIHFYDWLAENTTIVVETNRLDKIRQMFNLDEFKRSNESYIHQIESMTFRNREINKPALVDVLQTDGFIFVA
jgi:hypothetical protein